jgi:hypothetical protein
MTPQTLASMYALDGYPEVAKLLATFKERVWVKENLDRKRKGAVIARRVMERDTALYGGLKAMVVWNRHPREFTRAGKIKKWNHFAPGQTSIGWYFTGPKPSVNHGLYGIEMP